MRARQPDQSGYVVNDGVRVYYEVFGAGTPTILLMPTFPIVDSRHWKAQIPYLARHFRVVSFDPRGNGKSDRPDSADAYADTAYVADAGAVLDVTDTRAAVVAGVCTGVRWSVLLASQHPDRVLGLVAIAPSLPGLAPPHPHKTQHSFDDELDSEDGWAKLNKHYWRRDWRGFVEFHSACMFAEPHSTRLYDDMVEWGMQTDPETMIRCEDAPYELGREAEAAAVCGALRCPVLVLHGDRDLCQPLLRGTRFAELTGGRLVVLEGAGHLPHARHPVTVNRLIKEFVDIVAPAPRETAWLFARERKRRVLWICSPIGLGHVLRDLAIVRALRERVPDLEVHWWTQPPVTSVLESEKEIVHPVSAELASESAHWESEAAHHDLNAFYAFRRMDEILCANYMLFDDVVRETPYDLWVGDEAWEVDHFLHENPERKLAPYVFLTDVIGFLPTDEQADPREAELCADYNAEQIEHLARFPYIRDASVFIGAFDELPDSSFGPGLPRIRDWAPHWFRSVPYVVPFDPAAYRDPAGLRVRLGYDVGYPLLVAAVGGTAVGRDLLDLTAEGFAHLRKEVPDAQMVMVTGPRIDPRDLPDIEGMHKRGYVHRLFEHLACADVAVVQGGLSTTMELVATRRPFLYFPLRHHWEQQHFVDHRLRHYRAGIRMDYATTSPADLAAATRRALTRRPRYRAVRQGGDRQVAEHIAGLLDR